MVIGFASTVPPSAPPPRAPSRFPLPHRPSRTTGLIAARMKARRAVRLARSRIRKDRGKRWLHIYEGNLEPGAKLELRLGGLGAESFRRVLELALLVAVVAFAVAAFLLQQGRFGATGSTWLAWVAAAAAITAFVLGGIVVLNEGV